MNNNIYKLLIPAICFSILSCSVYASESHYTAPNPQLVKANKGYFRNSVGVAINYPCSFGGEPLVIYSTPVANTNLISSQSTIYPLYVKNSYEATTLTIPHFQKNELKSTKDLIVETINPAFGKISFGLKRTDGQRFYVDTANFPVVEVTSEKEGTKDKYVSNYSVNINDTSKSFAENEDPAYNYSFDEDTGLYVFHSVKQITANVASWNQNSKWSNASLGRNVSNIGYKFTPQASDDPNIYNGFGFWICGSDHKGVVFKPKNNKNIYRDQLIHNH